MTSPNQRSSHFSPSAGFAIAPNVVNVGPVHSMVWSGALVNNGTRVCVCDAMPVKLDEMFPSFNMPECVIVNKQVPLDRLKSAFGARASSKGNELVYLFPREDVDIPSFNAFHAELRSKDMAGTAYAGGDFKLFLIPVSPAAKLRQRFPGRPMLGHCFVCYAAADPAGQ